jgi:DNA repair protein RadA/Sms
VAELDRVLGGGLVAGSVTLVGGEPGIGKSTLLLEVAGRRARAGDVVLYVSGEESAQQVRGRAGRTGAVHERLLVLAEADLDGVIGAIAACSPSLVVVDSIQSIADHRLPGVPGSVAQVRECTYRLVHEAKARALPVVLVGHVTKDGALAGPRLLEHVVDTVLSFEGDRHHALRLLRAVKHRFGSTSELGVFEMTGGGLRGVADPSSLFLADRCAGVPGSVVGAVLDGYRPLLVEVQALVAHSLLGSPRRQAIGVDAARLSLLLAVLEQRAGITVAGSDVFVSVAGGVRLGEPGADLAVCLAVASAALGRPVVPGLVAAGEVGLSGELRQVAQTPRRLAEAARLAFGVAIVPRSAPAAEGIDVVRVSTVAEALIATGVV